MSERTATRRVICIEEGQMENAGFEPRIKKWADANRFTGQRGRVLAVPDADGGVDFTLFGTGPNTDPLELTAGLASAALAPGCYALMAPEGGVLRDPALMALGFRLGTYRFDQFVAAGGAVELEPIENCDWGEVTRLTEAAFVARDLINLPPNVLGPDAFETRVRTFATQHKMDVEVISGDALLAGNFEMIHAVGRASAEAPRLIDLRWGTPGDALVTLVGKGVTFDTGGLDIKTAAGMLLMKKDMGGAANILGLAHAIMDARLNVRLRVLLPIVENAISGRSFRPGDILRSRAGFSVEIGNTDAEGRLILADALSYGDEETPELMIDMATLTGAARVALGPDLPALFNDDDVFSKDLVDAGLALADPVWRMPLWTPYERMLGSKVADVNHIAQNGFAGSIVAALFLKKFVRQAKSWAHLDIFGWAPEARAGRSAGGTDQGIRAVYGALKARFG